MSYFKSFDGDYIPKIMQLSCIKNYGMKNKTRPFFYGKNVSKYSKIKHMTGKNAFF